MSATDLPPELVRHVLNELIALEPLPPPASTNYNLYGGHHFDFDYLGAWQRYARRHIFDPLEHLDLDRYIDYMAIEKARQRARCDMHRFLSVCKGWRDAVRPYRDQLLIINLTTMAPARAQQFDPVRILLVVNAPYDAAPTVWRLVQIILWQTSSLNTLLLDDSTVEWLEPTLQTLPRKHQQLVNLEVRSDLNGGSGLDNLHLCDTLQSCSKLRQLSLAGHLACDWTEVLHAATGLEDLVCLLLENVVSHTSRRLDPPSLGAKGLEHVRLMGLDGLGMDDSPRIWHQAAPSLQSLDYDGKATRFWTDGVEKPITAYPRLRFLELAASQRIAAWTDSPVFAGLVEKAPALEHLVFNNIGCMPVPPSNSTPSALDRLRTKVGNGTVRFFFCRYLKGHCDEELVNLIENPPPEWTATGVKAYWYNVEDDEVE